MYNVCRCQHQKQGFVQVAASGCHGDPFTAMLGISVPNQTALRNQFSMSLAQEKTTQLRNQFL
jgi:hypothetical protein